MALPIKVEPSTSKFKCYLGLYHSPVPVSMLTVPPLSIPAESSPTVTSRIPERTGAPPYRALGMYIWTLQFCKMVPSMKITHLPCFGYSTTAFREEGKAMYVTGHRVRRKDVMGWWLNHRVGGVELPG